MDTFSDIEVLTLAQFAKGADWRLTLAQDRPDHLLIWITRGQGRLLLDGLRRGVGAHNAIWVPQGALFALDLGRQGMAQVVKVPGDTPLRLPQMPRHLRIRDVHVQSELTGLIEAAGREQTGARPPSQDALEAHAALVSVWLRRQIVLDEHVLDRRNAAARLSQRYCLRISERFRSGDTMGMHAQALGVTPTHLSRAVKASTGKTAAELLTERTLFEARRLLDSTDRPAQDIARFLGFGSAAYFTRFMQHHTGRPPSKLRGPTA